MRLLLLLCTCLLLSGCGMAPDRWNVGYSRQPASGVLPARDTYTVGVSGPLFPGHATKEVEPAVQSNPLPR